VERFRGSGAIPVYQDAIAAIVRRYRMAG
jgi:hypothetical protein